MKKAQVLHLNLKAKPLEGDVRVLMSNPCLDAQAIAVASGLLIALGNV
jgi:hypothetical protein